MIIIYLLHGRFIISDLSRRTFLTENAGAEMVTSFHSIQVARRWAEKCGHQVIDLVKTLWTGMTPEGKQRLREARQGEKNCNFGGLTHEHRRNIARAMKVRRGEFHHFYNKKHRVRSRLQTSVTLSETWRKHPTRWAVDEFEHSHRITGALPPGWRWGRVKFR